jgi:hypothetical protein
MERNIDPALSNIAPLHRNHDPALRYRVVMEHSIASMLCNIALVSHTPIPETSTRGSRFICTAASLRGRRVLIGDSFAGGFGGLALNSSPSRADEWNDASHEWSAASNEQRITSNEFSHVARISSSHRCRSAHVREQFCESDFSRSRRIRTFCRTVRGVQFIDRRLRYEAAALRAGDPEQGLDDGEERIAGVAESGGCAVEETH